MAKQPTAGTNRVFTLVLVMALVATLYLARDVLVPLALALLLSFVLAPLVKHLERWHIGRWRLGRLPSVVLVVALTFVFVSSIAWLLASEVVHLADKADRYQKAFQRRVTNVKSIEWGPWAKLRSAAENFSAGLANPRGRDAGDAAEKTSAGNPLQRPVAGSQTPASPAVAPSARSDAIVERLLGGTRMRTAGAESGQAIQPVPVVITETGRSPLWVLTTLVSPVMGALVMAGVVTVFVFFMLMGREDLRNRLIRLIGPGRLTVTTQVLDDTARRVSRYLQMQLIVNGSYGLLLTAGLYLIGIPNAALWGFLAAVLRYIPYVGPWIAAAFPIALSLVAFPDNSWLHPAQTVALFLALELISNNIMEPVLYGSSTGVSTIGIIIAAVFWTWLWGPIGLMLSTPLTVCIVVLGRHVPQFEFFNVLLSDEPSLDPAANYYQRLLAGDEDEANRVIEKQLEEKSVAELYDEVLLPALILAEQDNHRGLLYEGKLDFVHECMRELIEELGERLAATTQANGNGAPATQSDLAHHSIICLPARDDADELAALMLAQLLEARGLSAQAASAKSLASEMLEQVEEQNAGIMCVSAVPPFAATHARYLCKRAHGRFPDRKLVIGMWTARTNGKKAEEQLKSTCADRVFTTLSQAVEQIS